MFNQFCMTWHRWWWLCDTDGDVRMPEPLDSEAPSVAGVGPGQWRSMVDKSQCRLSIPTSFPNLLDSDAPFVTGMSGCQHKGFLHLHGSQFHLPLSVHIRVHVHMKHMIGSRSTNQNLLAKLGRCNSRKCSIRPQMFNKEMQGRSQLEFWQSF